MSIKRALGPAGLQRLLLVALFFLIARASAEIALPNSPDVHVSELTAEQIEDKLQVR